MSGATMLIIAAGTVIILGLVWWIFEEVVPVIVAAIVIPLSVTLVWVIADATARERAEWAEFVKAHECRHVGHTASYTTFGSGVDSKGRSIITSQYHRATDGYACNDGVTYWR